MTPETLAIPIAPASGCCSETTQAAGVLPIVSVEPIAEGCCSDKSTTTSLASALPVPGSSGEACSHHDTSVSVEAASSPTTTDDGIVAPDDASLIDALRTVIDPELMINIVDLGLVYSINQTDSKVLVEMTLTSPACPAGPQIISQAKMSLEKLPGVETAEIKLTMSPPWTPDRMTDDARDQLGIF